MKGGEVNSETRVAVCVVDGERSDGFSGILFAKSRQQMCLFTFSGRHFTNAVSLVGGLWLVNVEGAALEIADRDV